MRAITVSICIDAQVEGIYRKTIGIFYSESDFYEFLKKYGLSHNTDTNRLYISKKQTFTVSNLKTMGLWPRCIPLESKKNHYFSLEVRII